jgi:hypothetical protein
LLGRNENWASNANLQYLQPLYVSAELFAGLGHGGKSGAGGIVEQQPRHSENSIFDLVCSRTNREALVAAEA